MVWHGEGWAPPATLPKTHHMKMTTTTQSIPSQSSPGTRTAPSVASHQDGSEKYATDGPKPLRARNNITIGTWNVRLLRAEGKFEELTQEIRRYRWTCGQYCNPETNERGLRLLEFASYNNLKVANTSGSHKPSRRWIWHSPGGDYHNQIDYTMVKRLFQSSVNIAKTRSFPGAESEVTMSL